MRFTTYSKFVPELADAVNLQGLLDQLSDFLLQSGFAGQGQSFWQDEMEDGDRSLDALKQAAMAVGETEALRRILDQLATSSPEAAAGLGLLALEQAAG